MRVKLLQKEKEQPKEKKQNLQRKILSLVHGKKYRDTYLRMELAKQEKPLRVVCLPKKNTGDYSTTRVQKQSGKIKTNFIT